MTTPAPTVTAMVTACPRGNDKMVRYQLPLHGAGTAQGSDFALASRSRSKNTRPRPSATGARPVLIGPVTFLKLAKSSDAGFDPMTCWTGCCRSISKSSVSSAPAAQWSATRRTLHGARSRCRGPRRPAPGLYDICRGAARPEDHAHDLFRRSRRQSQHHDGASVPDFTSIWFVRRTDRRI